MVFDILEYIFIEVNIVFYEMYVCIFGLIFFVVVIYDIFIVWIWMFGQILLDKIFSFFMGKMEENVNFVDVL